MRKLLCTFALLGALPLFTACEQSVEDAQDDVIDARQDAAQDVRSEQQDVEQARQEGAQDIREEQRDLQDARQEEGLDSTTAPPPTTP